MSRGAHTLLFALTTAGPSGSGPSWTDIVIAVFTAIGSIALLCAAGAAIFGGRLAYLQLKDIRNSSREELILRLAVVYHDILPPKRRRAAALLSRLIESNAPVASATPEELNSFADVMRFFQTVYSAVSGLEGGIDRERNFPNDPVSLEFGRYASGYGAALEWLAGLPPDKEDKKSELLKLALPLHHHPLVMASLLGIRRKAESAVQLLTHQDPGEATDPDPRSWISHEFPRWTRESVREFLRREVAVKTGPELSLRRRRRPLRAQGARMRPVAPQGSEKDPPAPSASTIPSSPGNPTQSPP